MTRVQTAKRKTTSDALDDIDAYSVEEFCRRHGISPQLFYKLKPRGLMPPTFRLGARVLISREVAAEWRRARQTGNSITSTT